MTVFTEGRHAAEFILSEGDGSYSRDNIVMEADNGIVAAGTVLGKVTASGKFKPSAIGAADGSEVAAAINIYEVDTTGADVNTAAMSRHCEVNGNIITYAPDRDQQAEKDAADAELAAAGIIVRR